MVDLTMFRPEEKLLFVLKGNKNGSDWNVAFIRQKNQLVYPWNDHKE